MATFASIDRDVLRPWTALLVMAPNGAGFAADGTHSAIEGAAAGTSAVVTPPAAARPPL